MTCGAVVGKLFFALFSIFGSLELGSRLKYDHSVAEAAYNFVLEFAGVSKAPVEEELEKIQGEKAHERMWGHHSEDHDHDRRRERFHEAMRSKFEKVGKCHQTCGGDHECHKRCPKPWKPLEEKCEKFSPIVGCHKECRGDFACHDKCPMPACPRLAKKMMAAKECHKACAKGDHSCHHTCPKPMMDIAKKCAGLREIHDCHKTCGYAGGRECHHACPKMSDLWVHHREEALPSAAPASARSFVNGPSGSYTCPPGFDPIVTETDCKAGAAAIGEQYKNKIYFPARPSGCVVCPVSFCRGVYFNVAKEGKPAPERSVICKKASEGEGRHLGDTHV